MPSLWINCWAPADYSGEQLFSDMMLTARAPGSPHAPWDEKFRRDRAAADDIAPNGWPTRDFGIVVAAHEGKPGHLAGTYLLQIDGEADVGVVSGCPGVSVSPALPPTMPNARSRHYVTCTATADRIFLSFRNAKLIRGMSLLRQGTDAMPLHLIGRRTLEPFGGIRFMDLQGTNNNQTVRWEDRPHVGDAPGAMGVPGTQIGYHRGIPLEILINACKQLNKGGWFCVPHAADDEYVRQMATLFARLWPKNLPLYIQYSNEVGWNSMFDASRYVLGKCGGDWQEVKRFIARRTAFIGKTFTDAGAPAIAVLAGQLSNIEWLRTGIDALKSDGSLGHIGAIAGAPYIGGDSLQSLTDDLRRWVGPAMRDHQLLAMANRLEFLLYEFGIEQASLQKFRDDPGIGDIVAGLVRAAFDAVPTGHSGVCCWYCLAGGGYGANVFSDTPTATYKSLVGSARVYVPPALDPYTSNVMQPITPLDAVMLSKCRLESPSNIGFVEQGAEMRYLLRTPKLGRYDVTLEVASLSGGGQLAVKSGGAMLGVADVPATGSWLKYVQVAVRDVPLAEGLSELSVWAVSPGWNLGTIMVSPAAATTVPQTPTPTPPPADKPVPSPPPSQRRITRVRTLVEFSDGTQEEFVSP